jgi:hypothetical protein
VILARGDQLELWKRELFAGIHKRMVIMGDQDANKLLTHDVRRDTFRFLLQIRRDLRRVHSDNQNRREL